MKRPLKVNTNHIVMAKSKASEFSVSDARIARYAKALGHPARVAILRLLMSRETCYCGDIVEELPIAQATVSQHLKELKDAGLIQGEINPPKVRYCINRENLHEAKLLFADLLRVEPEKSCGCQSNKETCC